MSEFIQYTIIRFRPFPETGEFANVGIITFNPAGRELRYKIVPRRFRRVTQFFNALDPDIFSASAQLLQKELDHLAAMVERGVSGRFLLTELLKRDKESVWTFSDLRVVRDEKEADDVIDKLYGLYVGRNFVNSEYQEQLMVREVRRSLKRRGIYGYRERVIEDEIVPVKFPLVSAINGIRVIKPISLDQRTTIGVIDHAATWHDRLSLLLRRGRLDQDKVLLTIAGPSSSDASVEEAYLTARGELEGLGVRVIAQDDDSSLVEFALPGAEPRTSRLY